MPFSLICYVVFCGRGGDMRMRGVYSNLIWAMIALIVLLRVQHFAHSAAKDYAKVLLFLRICKRIVIIIVFCGVGKRIMGCLSGWSEGGIQCRPL